MAATAHVLVFPFPAQGHVGSMLKLAELLSLSGLHITFLNSDHNHRLLARNSGTYQRLSRRPTFRFRSITDGLEDNGARSFSRFPDLLIQMHAKSPAPFRDLLLDLLRHSDGWPALTCVIADGLFLTFPVDIANELGVPAMFFRTTSACCVWSLYCGPKLFENGELPFPENADLDEPIRSVTGMEGFLRRRDFPVNQRNATDADNPVLTAVTNATLNSDRARAFILNTIESLEPSEVSHIRARCPITYCIGPLNALLRAYYGEENRASSGQDSGSFWPEDGGCMTWLNAQPAKSVVYVSFGSVAVMSPADFREFWHGLVGSGYRFLWVVRRGLIEGSDAEADGCADAVATRELREASTERGYLVEWVPQEAVLGHPAVGCFLTHSGWNSTLESLVAGVPMLCWPIFGDQQINSRFVEKVWRVGVDMKDVHDRRTVERMVREVMEGERAAEVRYSAAEMAERARKSVEPGGSSFVQFEKLIQEIRSLKNSNTRLM